MEKSESFYSLPHEIYVKGTPPLTFSYEYSNIFRTSYFTKQIQTTDCRGFYLLRMSNDYCFRRTAHGKRSQCNKRNTATILRALVKSNKGIKGKKVFACGCSGRNLKNFPKFTGKRTCRSPFIVKLQPEIAIKKPK